MSLPSEHLNPAEVAERRKAIMLRVVRAAFFILMVTFALLAALQQQQSDNKLFLMENRGWLPVGVFVTSAMILFGLAITADLATPKKKISAITGVMFGVIAGVLATAALGFIIDLLLESWVQDVKALQVLRPVVVSFKVLLGFSLSYIGVATVLQTQDDFRLVVPYVEFAKQLRGVRPLLIDTTILIDGRIADIASTGFLQAPLVIPRFVIAELQALADSQDTLKRAKGRRGLEFTARLQRTQRLDVTIDETFTPGKAVDQMLIEKARSMPAVIVTTDLALAQVARIENITVLNLNDLANAIKSSLAPGEPVMIKLLRQGEQPGQAVGYLPDGTMVVAENGAQRIGQTVEMIVQSSLQTSAGRLIFARIPDRAAGEPLPPEHPPEHHPEHSSQHPPEHHSAPVISPAPASPQDTPAPAQTAPVAALPVSPVGPTAAPAPAEEPRPRSPFPPQQSFRPTRPGTPRNPRR